MRHLPYFKFYCNEWVNGNIALEDMHIQGLFVNICCYYWSRKGDVTLDQLYKKFQNKEAINILKDSETFKIKYKKVSITFLDEQLGEVQYKAEISRKNGKNGGRPKKPAGLLTENPEKPNIDKKRREEIRKDKKRVKSIKPPELWEVKAYFCENGYTEKSAEDAFNYYEAGNWHDSQGNKVKSWKQKMRGVWFKPENLTKKENRGMW